MQHVRVLVSACLVVWSIGWNSVSTVFAAQPADAIPDTASFVVRWKAPQTTLGRLSEFVDAIQPGIGGTVAALAMPSVGQAIGNPGLAGVDNTQDWWMIGFAESGAFEPSIVYIVTAKNVDSVKKAVGDEHETHVVDKLVLYSQDDDALARVRDQIQGKGASLWSRTDPAAKKVFDESDLSVMVNLQQLAEEFENELNEAEPQMQAAFDQIESLVPDDQRALATGMVNVYRYLGKGVLQCVRESNSLAMGLSFSKSAIRYESTLQVNQETELAGFLAKRPPSALPLLSRLPAGQSLYYGYRMDVKDCVELQIGVYKYLLPALSVERFSKLEAALKETATVKFEDVVTYFDLASTAPAIRSGSVSIATPTKRLRELSHEVYKIMAKYEEDGSSQTTTLEPAIDTIGGTEIDRITSKTEDDAASDPAELSSKLTKIVEGEHGMQQLEMYQPTRVLQVIGGKSDLQSLIAAVDSTTTKDSPHGTARQRLAEKANVLVLVDVARLIFTGAHLADAEGDLPVDISALDGLKLEPSFIGYSLTFEPTAIRTQIDIPVDQIQNIIKVVLPLIPAAQ